MKLCLVCSATAPDAAHTCAMCGSADWKLLSPKPSAPAPSSDPVPSSREKRNR